MTEIDASNTFRSIGTGGSKAAVGGKRRCASPSEMAAAHGDMPRSSTPRDDAGSPANNFTISSVRSAKASRSNPVFRFEVEQAFTFARRHKQRIEGTRCMIDDAIYTTLVAAPAKTATLTERARESLERIASAKCVYEAASVVEVPVFLVSEEQIIRLVYAKPIRCGGVSTCKLWVLGISDPSEYGLELATKAVEAFVRMFNRHGDEEPIALVGTGSTALNDLVHTAAADASMGYSMQRVKYRLKSDPRVTLIPAEVKRRDPYEATFFVHNIPGRVTVFANGTIRAVNTNMDDSAFLHRVLGLLDNQCLKRRFFTPPASCEATLETPATPKAAPIEREAPDAAAEVATPPTVAAKRVRLTDAEGDIIDANTARGWRAPSPATPVVCASTSPIALTQTDSDALLRTGLPPCFQTVLEEGTALLGAADADLPMLDLDVDVDLDLDADAFEVTHTEDAGASNAGAPSLLDLLDEAAAVDGPLDPETTSLLAALA